MESQLLLDGDLAPFREAARFEGALDDIKYMARNLKPGDKLIIERHSKRQPADRLFTATIKEFSATVGNK